MREDLSRARIDADRFFGSFPSSESHSTVSGHNQGSAASSIAEQQHVTAVPINGISDDSPDNDTPKKVEPKGFFRQFFRFLSRNGNWKDLGVVSLNWALLDFTFYLLGVNSSSFVPTLFGEDNGPERPPYSLLIGEARHIIYSSTIGSLVGSVLVIGVMHFRTKTWFPRALNSPRRIQSWGFGVLAVLFVIVGSLYYTLPETRAFVAIVLFYQICNLFYNFGKFST